MNKRINIKALLLLAVFVLFIFIGLNDNVQAAGNESNSTQVQQVSDNSVKGAKSMASGIAIGLASLGGAIAMGLGINGATQSISRQPEAEDKIRPTLMLGLVFIETVVIYALIVTILIIFVL